MLPALLALTLAAPPVAGAFPIVPAVGPLARKSPEAQAKLLSRWGFKIAGGEFEDDRLPQALREQGLRTMGMVSLFQGANYWKKHPQSRPIDARGRPIAKDGWYAGVCPNQEWLRKEKLDEISGMMETGRYDILVLDFLRFPGLWQRKDPNLPQTCYCKTCLARFKKDTGAKLPNGSVAEIAKWIEANERDRWYQWRAGRITDFVHDVRTLRDRASAKTLIGVIVVPWMDERLLEVAGQDLHGLAAEADVFLPTSYHQMVGKSVRWVADVNAYVAKETKKPVWPMLLFDEARKLSNSEWDAYLAHALRHADGVIAFPFKSIPRSRGLQILTQQLLERAPDEGLETEIR